MTVRWTTSAQKDLVRLHKFLAGVNAPAATKVVQGLVDCAKGLRSFPRRGGLLAEFAPREVRRVVIGDYELRYEVKDADIYVLRLWHCREDR